MVNVIFSGLFYGFLIALPVGPANIELIKRGLNAGFKEAFRVGIGVSLSDAVLCILVYFGIVKIILASKIINALLGLSCSALMIHFGVSGLREIFVEKHKPDVLKYLDYKTSKRDPLLTGFMINLSNPMVIGFWVVFLGAVTSYSDIQNYFFLHPSGGIFLFSFSVFAGSLGWAYILCKIVEKGRKYITNSIFEIISFICSGLFIIFGLALIRGVIKTLF